MRPSTPQPATVAPPDAAARTYNRMFTIMFDDASENLALRVRTLSALRLFHILPRYLSHQDWRRVDQKGLAAMLQTAQASISRGLAELLEMGVIERRQNGRNLEWRLSPDYTWKGDVTSYQSAAERRRLKFEPPAGIDQSRRRDIMELSTASKPRRLADLQLHPVMARLDPFRQIPL